MNIFFYTLGCKVNQYESQVMGERLKAEGHKVVSDIEAADCAVINSCTVTAESDRKTRQAVRRMRRKLPNGVIILAGCMPQAFPADADLLPEADIVTGNASPENIPRLLDRFLKDGERIVEISAHERGERYSTPSVCRFEERTRAYMKVEDGCDRYCTYCIIPKARGDVRSRSVEEIEAEAQRLAQEGYKEIVLVGINLTSYGKDTGKSICDAVSAAARPEGIKRVRLGSLEPDHISDETLESLSREKKFCPQFHLALQSGCDATLKRMNRRYDTAFYRGLVKRIRDKFENPSITTDIMVGFAGETREEFEQSVAFFREIGFARAHVFAYSRREGTVAAALKAQVEPAEKERRAAEMAKAADECEEAFLRSQIGSTVSVLVESCEGGRAEGYTENYTRLRFPAEEGLTGEITTLIVTEDMPIRSN